MTVNQKGFYRVIDANFNRAKEGLRVCEDICRFVLDQKALTNKYKEIRHDLTELICSLNISRIIQCRNIADDVGKKSIALEMKRKEINDIYYANSQRIKESIRVLEEFSKLLSQDVSLELKTMRYKIYAIEQKIIKKF